MGQYGKYRSLVIAGAVTAALSTPALSAQPCRLALVLAIDVSSSVDAAEDALQRRGLAAALIAPNVQAAFFASPLPVALAAYEWSGRDKQALLLDWRLIETPADLVAAARVLGKSRRGNDDYPTAMGYALGYGAGLLNRGPDCLARTLDMAGDGKNNEGFPPASAYRAFPFQGTKVNGLAILGPDQQENDELIGFYRNEVLRGPGAFLEIAWGFRDYERAMRRKLERELAVVTIGLGLPARTAEGRGPVHAAADTGPRQ